MRARKLLDTIVRHGGEAVNARDHLTAQLGTYVIPELVKQCVNPPLLTDTSRIRFTIGQLSGGWHARKALAEAIVHELRAAVSVESKRAGLDLFRSYPSDSGVSVVLALLDDRAPRVRMAVVWALCSLETRHYGIKHAEKLVRALLDEDADVARYAAQTLKSLAHPRVLRLVVDTLPKISDPAVAKEARMAMWSIEGQLEADGVPNGASGVFT